MAAVAARHLTGLVSGCIVTRHGHGVGVPIPGIEVIEARHPVPDGHGLEAGRKLMELAAEAGPDDRVQFLMSGGGSALLCAPAAGITFAEKQAMTDHLVRSGAPISSINLVRRHLSRIKGGRLAALAGARGAELITYCISDVAGNDPALIASGPSIAAPFVPELALSILESSGWQVTDDLAKAVRANPPATSIDHPVHMLATNDDALDAIAVRAAADGWSVVDAGRALTGDAAEAGRRHAELAMDHASRPGRHLLLSGGELTVHNASKSGRGGPNLEYLTGLLSALNPLAPVCALAGDSDGIDGTEDNAGGYIEAQWAVDTGIAAALAEHRTYDLFAKLGGLVITGPTRTNVNDIRMIGVEGPHL
jgi:hydroxypyruvate reductase